MEEQELFCHMWKKGKYPLITWSLITCREQELPWHIWRECKCLGLTASTFLDLSGFLLLSLRRWASLWHVMRQKKNIILERNAHFCLELKYIFIWEYLLEISKQINEQKMVRVKEKSFYRHLFMSIFCLVSKHYPSFMVYASGWTKLIPPWEGCLFSHGNQWLQTALSMQMQFLFFFFPTKQTVDPDGIATDILPMI